MSDAIQIFGLDEVRERAAMAPPSAKFINIYQGHIRQSGGQNILTLSIRRDPNTGEFPSSQLDYVKRLRGNFTAVIMPTKEFFYITSGHSMNGTADIYGLSFDESSAASPDIQQLVSQLLNFQSDNERLRVENQTLREELAELETGADKFSYALEKLFYRVAPVFGITGSAERQPAPMQGTAENWQNIDVTGNDEQAVEAALYVLLESFGQDKILQFARKIQANPQLVNSLSLMI